VKVLIIDDVENTKAAKEALVTLGYNVAITNDSSEFLKELCFVSKRKGLRGLIDNFRHRTKINYDMIFSEQIKGTVTVVIVLLGEMCEVVNVIIDCRVPRPLNDVKKIIMADGYIGSERIIKNWPRILEEVLSMAQPTAQIATAENFQEQNQ
jgi:CheY-like chemotaxis protein